MLKSLIRQKVMKNVVGIVAGLVFRPTMWKKVERTIGGLITRMIYPPHRPSKQPGRS